jgi:hypothetical protein
LGDARHSSRTSEIRHGHIHRMRCAFCRALQFFRSFIYVYIRGYVLFDTEIMSSDFVLPVGTSEDTISENVQSDFVV